MSFIGLIPLFGPMTKTIVKTAKAASRINGIVNCAKFGGNVNNICTAYCLGKKSGSKIYDWIDNERKNFVNTVRLAENNFSDGMDYLRYDNGFLASSVRAVSTVACDFASAAINIPKNIFKQGYYIGG